MPRNSLTKPSNFSRTQHERRSRSSDQGCAGRRGSGGRLLGTLASWNMMLRRKNAASPARSPNPPSRKIALDRARSGAPISPQCNRAPKPPNRAHRRRGTLAKSQCKPNFRRLVPTMMASTCADRRRYACAARANHGKFGLDNLALVVGGSMGAQQTYEWAVRYPIL